MVSSKRQISTYRDHFGGYGEEALSTETPLDGLTATAPATSDISDAPVERELTTPHFTTRTEESARARASEPAAPASRSELYTTVAGMTAAVGEPEIAAPFAPHTDVPQREKREKNKLNTDIKPSQKTQDSIKHAAEPTRAAAPSKRSGGKIDPRTKVMLLVYVIIAAVLAVAVIATGVSITNSSAQTQSLYDEIAQIQQGISGQEAEISNINETMHDRAVELGMVDAGEPAGSVSRIDKVDYPEATPHSNWFDRFSKAIADMIN